MAIIVEIKFILENRSLITFDELIERTLCSTARATMSGEFWRRRATRTIQPVCDILGGTARHGTAGVKSSEGVFPAASRDATQPPADSSRPLDAKPGCGGHLLRRRHLRAESIVNPEGGAAGGARHRMIALIRADGRSGKRAGPG